MSKQTEVLKLALEALEEISSQYMSLTKKGCMALDAICEVLAQPEGCQCHACKVTQHASDCAVHNEPAYPKGSCDCGAQPKQEQGDSNCQADDGCPTEMAVLQRFWRGEPIPTEHYPEWFRPAQQQEPEPDRVKFERHWRKTRGEKKANRELPRHPLQPQTYIQDSANRHWVTWQAAVRSVSQQPAQPSKPWVGLTQQEQASVLASVPTVPFDGDWHLALFTAIEAKLKEKNA